MVIQPPRIDQDLIGDAFFTFSGASLDGVEKMMAEVLPEGLGSQHLEPFSLWVLDLYRRADKKKLSDLAKVMLDCQKQMNEMLSSVDILLTPTQPYPARELGFLAPELDPGLVVERTKQFARYTAFHNIAGSAAMSVPRSLKSAQDFLYHCHFAAAPGRDGDLLNWSSVGGE